SRSHSACDTTWRSGPRRTEPVSCGWIHRDCGREFMVDPPAGDNATGSDDKRTPGSDVKRSPGSAEMRRRTRGISAGSQIQRAGSTSSKSASSESVEPAEAFVVPAL